MNNKIHIMHVIYEFSMGGLENRLVNLMNVIDPNVFNFSICCIKKSGIMATRIKRKDIKIFELHRKSKNYLICLKLAMLFRKEKVDVIHTHGWSGFDGVIGAKLARVPVIIHSEQGKDIEDIYSIKKRRLWGRKLISYLANQVVTVSEEIKDSLVKTEKISPDKILTIHNGVDIQRFNINIDKIKKKEEVGIGSKDIVIGTVGRLDPIKSYDTFLYCAKEVISEFPDLRFLLVGDGPMRKNLEELSTKLGLQEKVTFIGERLDIPELLNIMDIFVLPSLSEGLSNTILEAMASGLPIITTRVGGNPEIIIDGETGFLVPPTDYQSLSKVLIQLLKAPSLAKKIGLAGQERAKRHFSLSKMVSSYEALYKELSEKHIRGKSDIYPNKLSLQ